MTTSFWKMIPPKSIDVSTIRLTANYLANSGLINLSTGTYGSIIGGGYKNIQVAEGSLGDIRPRENFLLTMQAITA